MDTREAKEIVRSIEHLHDAEITSDADTYILQIKDTERGPRNFYPDALAELLSHDAVFDAWVEDNKFFIQLN